MSANVRISNLPTITAAALVDTDILPVVAGIAGGVGVTSKITISELRLKLGTQAPGGGRTVASAATYLANNAVFNVKDFGAVGVNGAIDDTAAFAATMTALVANGGGVFYIPQGTYKADFPTIGSNCTIRGDGRGVTVVNAFSVNAQIYGPDVSNVIIERFSFIGKANSGAATTNIAIWLRSINADMTNITIRELELRQFKAGSTIRINGNGDLVTTATHRVTNVWVENNRISELYDLNPALIGQEAALVYIFGGVDELFVRHNALDATTCKQGVFVQTDATGGVIAYNSIKNAGLANDSPGSHAVICYSSYASSSVSEMDVSHNRINWTARAAIYFAAVNRSIIHNNRIVNGDANGTGLGTVGSGAIMVNSSQNDVRNGVVTVQNNHITDPGKIGIYIDVGQFGIAETHVIGNMLKMTSATNNKLGIVLWGKGILVEGNSIMGFLQSIFLYTTADNALSDLTIADNQIDGSLSTGTRYGITWNTQFLIGPTVVKGNRFRSVETMIDLRNVSDLVIEGNIGVGIAASGIIAIADRGIIKGNIATGGINGMIVQCLAATATSRILVEGNIFPNGSWTTPLAITENTGQIIVTRNAGIGTQPGRAADSGDANLASATNQPSFEVFPYSTTLTANRSVTLNATKAYRGDLKTVVRDAVTPGAFTLALINNLGTTLGTIPANTRGFITAIFDGTNWVTYASGTYA